MQLELDLAVSVIDAHTTCACSHEDALHHQLNALARLFATAAASATLVGQQRSAEGLFWHDADMPHRCSTSSN